MSSVSVYIILYIHPNSATQEKFAIGLIFADKGQILYRHSESKLRAISHIYTLHLLPQISQILVNIESFLLQVANRGDEREINFLLDYTDYLYRYSGGLLQFSEANFFSESVDQGIFNKLFDLLILRNTIIKN